MTLPTPWQARDAIAQSGKRWSPIYTYTTYSAVPWANAGMPVGVALWLSH
jgi:hypothetical protein